MKEMGAKDLRIGNLIYSKRCGCNFHKGVIEIDFEAFRKIHLFDGLNGLEPILITEEWLLKFGFKEVIVDSWYSKLAKNKNTIIISKSGLVAINDDKPIIAIEYVHQLQNLYFALTGTELEYNERK